MHHPRALESRNRKPAARHVGPAVALILAALCAQAGAAPLAREWAEGRILVQARAGLDDEEFTRILDEHGAGRALRRLNQLDTVVVEVPPGREKAMIRALLRSPHVKFAELDRVVELADVVPNDPQYPAAWHLPKIKTPAAWMTSQGSGVTVAVLDTGVDASHPDLSGQLLTGWNTVSNNTATSDIYGHGTKVAGTIGAVTNNSQGVASVAYRCKLLPVRISNDSAAGLAYTSDISEGITWAVDHGALVANISYDLGDSSTISYAAQYMRNRGGLVVAAAGNSGASLTNADNPYVIVVSATDSSDNRASWSNYGTPIDVSAPGVGIWTTTRGGGYASVSGTSFASPTAAGVTALIIAANSGLAPAEVERVLEASAYDPIAGVAWHPYFGNGRVDASAAVQLAKQSTSFDTVAPSVSVFNPKSGQTVSGVVPVDVSATDNEGVTEVAFYAGGKLVGRDTVAPYQFSWNTRNVPKGTALLQARAWDASGNEGLSVTVSVTVKR